MWWNAPIDMHHAPAVLYRIRREVRDDDDSPANRTLMRAAVGPYTVRDGSGFLIGTTGVYRYHITAVSRGGATSVEASSKWIGHFGLDPTEVPGNTRPPNLDVTGKTGMNSSAHLTWDRPLSKPNGVGETETLAFEIDQRIMARNEDWKHLHTKTVEGSQTRFEHVVTNMSPPGRYLYRVRAMWIGSGGVDEAVRSNISRWVEITIPDAERMNASK